MVTIHKSGQGAEKLEVVSYHNGLSYSVNFGEAGAPMRNVFFQGDDAAQLRNEVDAMEAKFPDMLTCDVWLAAVGPYL